MPKPHNPRWGTAWNPGVKPKPPSDPEIYDKGPAHLEPPDRRIPHELEEEERDEPVREGLPEEFKTYVKGHKNPPRPPADPDALALFLTGMTVADAVEELRLPETTFFRKRNPNFEPGKGFKLRPPSFVTEQIAEEEEEQEEQEEHPEEQEHLEAPEESEEPEEPEEPEETADQPQVEKIRVVRPLKKERLVSGASSDVLTSLVKG